jgi:SIT4-associating protein SAP185/190
VQTSAGDFLKAIITISANATQNDQSCIGPNSLTRQLVSAQCVETLIKAMLQGGNPLTVGVGIVIEVIRKNNSDYDPETMGGPDSPPTTYDPIYLGILLRIFAKHIPDFMTLIRSSKHTINDNGKVRSVERGQLSSAWGAKIEPLGFDRFKTCELMAELLHCSNMGLLNEPGSDEYVRQRDAERERLFREGAFNPHKESSALEGNDSTTDLINGSVLDTGSPEDSRVLEISNAGEDGFEDVDSSGVLVDKEKLAERTEPESRQTEPEVSDASRTSASMNDKENDSGEAHDHAEAETDTKEGNSSDKNLPPTVSDLTDQLNAMDLGDQRASEETTAQGDVGKSEILPSNDSESPSAAQMSSDPAAVPAPLFSTQQQEKDSVASTPDTAGQVGNFQDSTDRGLDSVPSNTDAEDLRAHLNSYVQLDPNGQPVVGDYLKIMFVKNKVVPTILVS